MSGMSDSQIGKKLGVSRSTARRDVERHIRKLELERTESGNVRLVQPTSRRSRMSRDGNSLSLLGGKIQTIVAPDDHVTDWHLMELDRETLNRLAPSKLVELLVSNSPPASRALWDYLRLCDAGHRIDILKPNAPDQVDERARDYFQENVLGVIKQRHGSMKLITNRLFMSGYLRGAMFVESVLNKREFVDIVVPDPFTVRFRLAKDEQLGERWELGQMQEGKFVNLEYPTIRYLPVDPWPGKPYGRPPITPTIFPSLFLLGLAHDLRRVVAQQGYPRIDISVNLEKLAAAYPNIHRKGGQAWDELIDETLAEVVSVYSMLEPEDAFVHTDDQEVKRPVGALDGQAVMAADSLIKSLERMAVQSAKTMPLMLGITDGVSEANSNRQWEIFAAGIKSLQHLAETILADQFKVILQAAGYKADVKVTFHELRASELMRDEQTRQLRDQNSAFERDQGWLTPLEAAKAALEHEPSPEVIDELKKRPLSDPDKPIEPPESAGKPTAPAKVDPAPGESKAVELIGRDGALYVLEPDALSPTGSFAQYLTPRDWRGGDDAHLAGA